jgi:hypothetical protein
MTGNSLPHGHWVLSATPIQTSSSHTATSKIHSVPAETMPNIISSMAIFTGKTLWNLLFPDWETG